MTKLSSKHHILRAKKGIRGTIAVLAITSGLIIMNIRKVLILCL